MNDPHLHSLLRRQLRRCFGDGAALPSEWRRFVDVVDAAYQEFDRDRKMLERALDLSSQELLQASAEMRAVVKAIPDLLIRFDACGTILDCKTGAGGESSSPLAASPARLEFATRHWSAFADAANECARTKKIVAAEYALDQVDGRRSFEARIVPVLESQFVAFVRDITDRKQAEDELRRTVSLVTSTLESTADGILVVDQEGRIVRFNERFAELWRIPPEVLRDRADGTVLRHALNQLRDPDQLLEQIRELGRFPDRESSQILRFKDGRTFDLYSCPHRLGNRPIGRVWNFRDITERVQLEEQFRQSQKMEAIGRLAGGVAHDFNNLLTVLMANLSMLRAAPMPTPSAQTAINDCFDATRRAAGLTAQLLTFSRRQRINPQDVEFNEVVGNVAKMLRRLIGEHVTMTTQLGPERLYVNADVGMMEQMLMNLVVNARDAMPVGGELRIAVAGVEFTPARAMPPKARAGRFVSIAVSDTGTGIPPEYLPRIFEPFFTTKEVGRGTGLGLATVFGIVEQHGGWIDVQTKAEVGTTMTIYLPRIGRPAASEHSSPSPTLRGGVENVLVVEDESPVRTLISRILERHGYQVTTANDAREAIETWRRAGGKFDLLFTDVVMPNGIGGRELAKRLTAERPDLAVVFCSGYADDTMGGSESLRGLPNFLPKPFTVDALLERVRNTIDAAPRNRAEALTGPRL
jgi:PAS domain S-box-containing protein